MNSERVNVLGEIVEDAAVEDEIDDVEDPLVPPQPEAASAVAVSTNAAIDSRDI
jgi:hypothetical protein